MAKKASIKWPADKVERRKVDALIPYARNARTHSDEQVAQIAASIKEWGWTTPVLVDEDGGIIAGHGRIMAARKLGIDEVPVMVAAGWSEAQKRAYVLADNKLALNSDWDTLLLNEELAELKELNFDAELTGFTETELEGLANSAINSDEQNEGDGSHLVGDERFLLQIEYANENDLAEAYEKALGEGLKCVILT